MVTITDVADSAGVSRSTAARVLAGTPRNVDPALAARVREAAGRLGYRTNRLARALRNRRTQTIGMLVPDIANPFFPAVVQAVERELRANSLTLLLADSANDVRVEAELLNHLLEHQIDGLLISPCDRIASRQAVQLSAGRIPVVQVDRTVLGGGHFAGVDQARAMEQVVDHLVQLGRRRFAYITPADAISTAHDRLLAFRRAVRNIDSEAQQRVLVGDFSIEWGYQATERLLAAPVAPDAIVCANDLTAVGALQALHVRGVAVPEDVAVTGFDDTLLAVATRPTLTTVRQPLDQLGRAAVDVLQEAIADPQGAPRRRVLHGRLVVRSST